MKQLRLLPAVALGCSLAGFLAAQDTVIPPRSSDVSAGDQRTPSVFGTQTNIMQIPASAFTHRHSGISFNNDGFGYIYATSSPGTPFWAPVILPSGVRITYLNFYYYDNDATNSISARLQTYSGTNSTAVLATAVSLAGAAPGYGYAFGTPATPYTANNDVQYGGGDALSVLIDIPVATSNLAFRGVDIWWNRQVTPGPATATFSDVPTSSPQFKFVEALYAAGITGGCATGPLRYCPSDPVTRGQMAVFLAQALGLHYGDL